MTQSLGTFDFKKLNVIFGVAQLSGYADGDAIEIEEADDAFKKMSGADGFTDRIKNNANSLNIIIRLRQASPTNQVLSALHAADRAGGTPLPILIKDRSGTTLVSALQAWIVKFAKITRGTNVGMNEWRIETGSQYVVNIGGND